MWSLAAGAAVAGALGPFAADAFLLLIAGVFLLLLGGGRRSAPAWPGALSGGGLGLLWLAWSGRRHLQAACSAAGATCSGSWNGWLLAAGPTLVVLGVVGVVVVRERMVRRLIARSRSAEWRPDGW